MEPIVLRNTSRDTEREHLNKILKWVSGRLEIVEKGLDNISLNPGPPIEGAGLSLSVDPGNFNFNNIEGNSYYLDLAPEGVGTNELADLSVTYEKIDFTSFDSDDVSEGVTNFYFSDERAQDAVGTILTPSTFISSVYSDATPSITVSLSASGTPDSSVVLRGDNTWANGVTKDWQAGAYLIGNVRYIPLAFAVTGEINVTDSGVDYGAAHLIVSGFGSWGITGIIGGDPGRVFTISNDSSSTGSLFLEHEQATSTSDDIKTPTQTTVEITPGSSVTLKYVYHPILATPGYWEFIATTSTGGGGGGAVTSVNGQTGAVVLDAADVGAGVPLYPRRDDITAASGDIRFLLDKTPWQGYVDIYDDDRRLMLLADLTGTGRQRYLAAGAAGGEVYTVTYWTDAVSPGATIMDAAAALAWSPTYPDGEVGVAYDYTPSPATGGTGPYTYSYTGTLPPGLTFETDDGQLHGTPTDDSGSPYEFDAEVQDSLVDVAGSSQSVTVAPAYDLWDTAWRTSGVSYDLGDSRATGVGSDSYRAVRARAAQISGKRYFEILCYSPAGGHHGGAGVVTAAALNNNFVGQSTDSWGIYQTAQKYHNSAATTATGVPAAGAGTYTVRVAVDLVAGLLWFGHDAVLQGDPAAGTGASYSGVFGPLYPAGCPQNAGFSCRLVSDPSEFLYTIPAGFTGGWPA